MDSIKIHLSRHQLLAVTSTFVSLDDNPPHGRKEKTSRSILDEVIKKLQKKEIDLTASQKKVKLTLQYYQVEALETWLFIWLMFYIENDQMSNLVSIVANELNQLVA